MIKQKLKICKGVGKYLNFGCGLPKHIFSHGCCQGCANRAKVELSHDKEKGVPKTGLKRGTRKPTGEKIIFDLIAQERPMVSQISGERLITDRSHDKYYWQFFHILPKSGYNKFRARKDNILLTTWEEHKTWHDNKGSLKDDIKWFFVFELEEKLIEEYHRLNKIKTFDK